MTYKSLVITPVKYSDRNTVKKSQFYKGFSTIDETSADSRLYDYDLIKQDLLNQFNTRKNERVMNPNFGTVIWDLLFEPFTEAVKAQIAEDVTRVVSSDPRAIPLSINVIEQENGMLLEITMLYKGTDQTDQLKVSFDKQAGLNVV